MLRVWVDIVTLFFVVVGALNWGAIGLFGVNVVKELAKRTFQKLEAVVYVVVGLSALVHLFSRDYYLTFLGRAAFPCGSLVERVPEGADTEVAVTALPGASVVYWAAEGPAGGHKESPWVAYNEYANAGVAKAGADGIAVLRFRAPATYNVPMKGRLRAHVHYRVCEKNGMIGRVQSAYV